MVKQKSDFSACVCAEKTSDNSLFPPIQALSKVSYLYYISHENNRGGLLQFKAPWATPEKKHNLAALLEKENLISCSVHWAENTGSTQEQWDSTQTLVNIGNSIFIYHTFLFIPWGEPLILHIITGYSNFQVWHFNMIQQTALSTALQDSHLTDVPISSSSKAAHVCRIAFKKRKSKTSSD